MQFCEDGESGCDDSDSGDDDAGDGEDNNGADDEQHARVAVAAMGAKGVLQVSEESANDTTDEAFDDACVTTECVFEQLGSRW